MKKVIVFGGSGFLGSYISDELEKRNFQVVIADITEPKYTNNNQKFIYCDTSNKEDIQKVITDDTDYVYNFVAYSNIDLATKNPIKTFNLNIINLTHILEVCKNTKIKRFIFASSAYANSNKGSFYGISKFCGEKIIEEYSKKYSLAFTILRYGSLYGERADENNGLFRILKQAIEKKTIHHHGTGDEVREYIHAFDASRFSVDILDKKEYENKHIMLTGNEKTTQRDLLNMINEILNNTINIKYNNKSISGHYVYTPYSYEYNREIKITPTPHINLGNGILNCIKRIAKHNK